MDGRSVLISLGILILFFTSAHAADGEALSWEDCVHEARQHNSDLVSAQKKVDQAKADKTVTRSKVFPNVSASADAGKRSTAGVEAASYDYGVSGQQLLFDGFKTSNDLASATEKIKAASYNYKVVSSNVRLSLWSAFIGLLGAQESLVVTQDILKRRQQNVKLVTLRYKVGREHKGSLMTAQASFSQAQYDVEEAQRNVELYQRKLSKEMGRTTFVPFSIKGELVITAIDKEKPIFEKLIEASPVLNQVIAERESARFGLKSAKSALLPQVYANVGSTRSGSDWPLETRGWTAGLSVSFPLFEGGKQQAQISKARAAFDQAEADKRNERENVILTLAEAWIQWQNNVSFVSVRGEFLAASKERAMIAEGQYSAGLVTFDDWTIIEDDLVGYQKNFLQAKVNALVAEGNWLQAKGVTIDD